MSCTKHDDCRENPELARLCAEDAEMRDHATECPCCGSLSPCDDWQEIDLGVGVQRFDIGWSCLRCGRFAFDSDGQIVFERGGYLAIDERLLPPTSPREDEP